MFIVTDAGSYIPMTSVDRIHEINGKTEILFSNGSFSKTDRTPLQVIEGAVGKVPENYEAITKTMLSGLERCTKTVSNLAKVVESLESQHASLIRKSRETQEALASHIKRQASKVNEEVDKLQWAARSAKTSSESLALSAKNFQETSNEVEELIRSL